MSKPQKPGIFTGTWESYRKTELRKDTYNTPLDVYLSQFQHGEINASPPYQRGLVWSLEQKQRLINSVIVGLSIPAVYLRELPITTDGAYLEIVDGKQRLSALCGFVRDGFDYAGHLFSALPLPLQRSFRMTTVPTVKVSGLTDAETVELYERLNFGGVPQQRP